MKLRPSLLLALGALAALGLWRSAPTLLGWQDEDLAPLEREELAAAQRPGAQRSLEAAGERVAALAATPQRTRREASEQRPLYRISGRIARSAARPPGVVTIYVRRHPDELRAKSFSRKQLSKPAGGFGVNVPEAGVYQLYARGKGGGRKGRFARTSRVASVTLTSAQPRAEPELVFEPQLAIEGRLLTSTGQPLAGVSVAASVETPPSQLQLFGDAELPRSGSVKTSKNGRFRIYPLDEDTPPMRLDFQLPNERVAQILGTDFDGRASPLSSYSISGVVPGAPELELRIDAAQLRGGSVTVEPVFSGGAPPAKLGYQLSRLDSHGSPLHVLGGARTLDEEARFSVEGLELGANYSMQLFDGVQNSSEVFGPLLATSGGQVVRIAVPRATELTLTAVSTKGVPIRKASFSITPLLDEQHAARELTTACPKGRARVGAGTYLVQARWKRLSAQRVVEISGAELSLSLELAPRVRKQ